MPVHHQNAVGPKHFAPSWNTDGAGRVQPTKFRRMRSGRGDRMHRATRRGQCRALEYVHRAVSTKRRCYIRRVGSALELTQFRSRDMFGLPARPEPRERDFSQNPERFENCAKKLGLGVDSTVPSRSREAVPGVKYITTRPVFRCFYVCPCRRSRQCLHRCCLLRFVILRTTIGISLDQNLCLSPFMTPSCSRKAPPPSRTSP